MDFPTTDLHIAAARYVLGSLPSWEFPRIANALLDAGVYSQAVGELATTPNPTMSDAGPVFERALVEMRIELPSKEEAVWMLLRHFVEQLASRRVTGRKGLRAIIDVYNYVDPAEKSRDYVGESHDIQHLVGAYWSYDDLEERPTEVSFHGRYGRDAVQALDEDVIRLAREWLEQHGA